MQQKKNAAREPLPTEWKDPRDPTVVNAEVVTPAKEPEVMPPAQPTTPPNQAKEGETPSAASVPAQKAHVALNERGMPTPKDLDGMYRVIGTLFKGKAFPNWVKSPEQAFAVAQFLKNLGLEVMTGIQHVCEVNGRLCLWGEGPLAVVRASGKMKSIKEVFLDASYKEISLKNKNLDAEIFAAVCTMVRTDGERVERAFTVADAAKATQGVAAIWKGYKRIMFKRKARAECIKDLFGDVVLGAGIAEYDYETAPDMGSAQEGQPRASLADRMNDDVPQLEAPSAKVPAQ